MAKKRKIILSVVSLIVALFIGWWFVSKRQPSYNGRSLSEWADIGLKATDTTPWDIPNVLHASNAIRQIGPKAVPLAYAWSSKLPSSGPIDEQLNEFSAWVGWTERFPDGYRRTGFDSFRLRRVERGRFIAYALQEEMASGLEGLFRPGQQCPWWLLSSLNDRTLGLVTEQLPRNADSDGAMAVLREIGEPGRDKSVFGPVLWTYSQAVTNRDLHFTALSRLADSGFRAEETAVNLDNIPLSTNRDDSVSYVQIFAALRQLGPVGWPYLSRSLTNELPVFRRRAFDELALDYGRPQSGRIWMPYFRFDDSYFRGGLLPGFPSTNRLEFMAAQPVEMRRAFVEEASNFYPSRPRDFSAWDRTNAVVILSRFTNDPSRPIAARSLEVLQKINAMPPAQ